MIPKPKLSTKPGQLHPTDKDFKAALFRENIANRPVCKPLLEGLESGGYKERTPTSSLSIEHVMPRTLTAKWKRKLGDEWERVHADWVDRLGNLTLTGYNPEYSNRPFVEKRDMDDGGFRLSPVRINRWIAQQEHWTEAEISARSENLADRATHVWHCLDVDPQLVRDAWSRELREKAKEQPVSRVEMNQRSQTLFRAIRASLLELDVAGVVEMAENNHQVSYHRPEFFLEILPRSYKVLRFVHSLPGRLWRAI